MTQQRRIKSIANFTIKNRFELEEATKCCSDWSYLIDTYIMLPNVGEPVPFKLFPFQKKTLYYFIVRDRVITLKSRQMGLSTLIEAYALVTALMLRNQNILIVSIKEDVAKAMLNKIKYMYENLPAFLKVPVKNTHRSGNIGTSTEIEFANGSKIKVSPATENAGRSDSLSLLILDELAFQMYAQQIWASASPTLAFTKGKVIMNSTPFGVGNLYQEIYEDAIKGRNNFTALKLHWTLHPHYNKDWYDAQVRDLGIKRAKQELDCEFLSSGSPVLDIATLRAIEEAIKNSNPHSTFAEQTEGYGGFVYLEPTKGNNYVIGIDISSGRSNDHSAFSVMDMYMREVAYFKGKLTLNDLAELLIKVGNVYNNALLAPEANGIGEGLIELLLAKGYANVYLRPTDLKPSDYKKRDYQNKDKYGFVTSETSRKKIIDNLDNDLTKNIIATRNRFVVSEGYEFIYHGDKPIAKSKLSTTRVAQTSAYNEIQKGDDSILALAITNEVAKERRRAANINLLLEL